MTDTFRRGFDYIGISAVALIHDGKGNLLLQKRGPQARDERGKWDLCGGAIDFGETIEQTIIREVKEELCCEVRQLKFLTVYDALRDIAGKKTHWVAVVYAAEVDPKAVAIGEPHKIAELGWFRSSNLPAPLHSQFHKTFIVAQALKIVL